MRIRSGTKTSSDCFIIDLNANEQADTYVNINDERITMRKYLAQRLYDKLGAYLYAEGEGAARKRNAREIRRGLRQKCSNGLCPDNYENVGCTASGRCYNYCKIKE